MTLEQRADLERRIDPKRKFSPACFDCEWWHGKDQEWGECYLPQFQRDHGGEWPWIRMKLVGSEPVTLQTHRDFYCANWESDSDMRRWAAVVEDGDAG